MKYILGIILLSHLFSTSVAFAGAAGEVMGDTAKGAAAGAVVGFGAQKAMEAAGAKTLSESVGKFMGNPPGVMILAGIGMANSGILYSAAVDQEDESEANIKKVDRILATFKDSWVSFCPNGREELARPDCYCYNEDGSKNSNRSKSQTCVDLWAKNAYRLSAIAGTYSGIAKFVDPVGCMTQSGSFDEACKCKKFLDSKGNNSCMKGVNINVNGNGLGMGYLQNSGFNNVVTALTGQTSGNATLASLNAGKLLNAIAKQGDINNGLFQKIAADPSKKDFKIFKSNEEMYKAQGSIFNSKVLAAASNAAGKSAISSIAENRPDGNLKNLIKEAEKKTGIDLSGSGKGLANKKADSKEQFAFNLGGEANSQNGAAQMQDFPEQPKNYKINGDISKRSDANIFEIISNRYIQSGLKRLFEEN